MRGLRPWSSRMGPTLRGSGRWGHTRGRPGILVADRDPGVRVYLRRQLRAEGFAVVVAEGVASLLELIERWAPAAIILNLDLDPDAGGLRRRNLIRAVRRRSPAPLLALLDPQRGFRLADALDQGVDDCLAKPFLMSELLARLDRVLRRDGKPPKWRIVVSAEALEVNLVRQVVRRADRSTRLSRRECQVLTALLRSDGGVMRSRELADALWRPECRHGRGYLRSIIRILRQKIERQPAMPVHIVTERGLGYRFRLPENAVASAALDR